MNQGEPELSVVVPLHNEEGNAALLCEGIRAALDPLRRPYEVLLVDDGSTDRTATTVEGIGAADPRFRMLRLDANYGQAAALTAGFQAARGAYVLTMDGDLQNDPADFPRLLRHLEEGGFSVVSGWRQKRKGNLALRVIPSHAANWLISRISGLPSYDNGCSVKVYRAEVVKRVMLPHGFHRFLPAILGVRAEEYAQIPVSDRKRHSGQSHYGLSRLFAVIRDLLVLRLIIDGKAHASLSAANALCVFAAFLGVAAFQFWTARHYNPAVLSGSFAILTLAYGTLARAGLTRWIRTQSTPPFGLRGVSRAGVEAEGLTPSVDCCGTPTGGATA